MPPAYIADASGNPMHSWRVLILPFLEQRELYEQYDFNEPWNGPHNRRLLEKRPSIYAFHDADSQSGTTTTNYVAVVGDETAWPRSKSLSMNQISDGGELTILIVENLGDVPWTEPRDLDFSTMDMDVGARSANGISSRFDPPAVVTADGSVHTLSTGVAPSTLRALLTASGGESVVVDSNLKQVPDGRGRPEKGMQ